LAKATFQSAEKKNKTSPASGVKRNRKVWRLWTSGLKKKPRIKKHAMNPQRGGGDGVGQRGENKRGEKRGMSPSFLQKIVGRSVRGGGKERPWQGNTGKNRGPGAQEKKKIAAAEPTEGKRKQRAMEWKFKGEGSATLWKNASGNGKKRSAKSWGEPV